jgi:hypothetical protein
MAEFIKEGLKQLKVAISTLASMPSGRKFRKFKTHEAYHKKVR